MSEVRRSTRCTLHAHGKLHACNVAVIHGRRRGNQREREREREIEEVTLRVLVRRVRCRCVYMPRVHAATPRLEICSCLECIIYVIEENSVKWDSVYLDFIYWNEVLRLTPLQITLLPTANIV